LREYQNDFSTDTSNCGCIWISLVGSLGNKEGKERWGMKILTQSAKIMTIDEKSIDGEKVMKFLEMAARTCYQSEEGNTEELLRKVIDRGHESVIEHFSISAYVVTDRGISHEIVRHRIASYSQESTRYCNYSRGKFGGEITVIDQPISPHTDMDARMVGWMLVIMLRRYI